MWRVTEFMLRSLCGEVMNMCHVVETGKVELN